MTNFSEILKREKQKSKGWVNDALMCPNCGSDDLRLENIDEECWCIKCMKFVKPVKPVKPDNNNYPKKRYTEKGWLHEQYIVNRRTSSEIAEEVGVYPQTVTYHLRKNGIKVRKCGRKRER